MKKRITQLRTAIYRTLGFFLAAAVLAGLLPGPVLCASETDPRGGFPESYSEEVELQSEDIAPDSIPDTESLFADYAQRRLYGRSRRLRTASAQRNLSGVNQGVYSALREEIGMVADGKASDTVFRIPIRDLLGKTVFTAQDLGLAAVTGEDGRVTKEARDAVCAAIGLDSRAVILALLTDLPYALYWYDKTASYQWGLNLTASENGRAVSVSDKDCVVLQLPAAQGYADTRGAYYDDADGVRHFLSVDTRKTGAAGAAVRNAREIVEEAAELPDLGKLRHYAERICGMVEYDSEAGSGKTGDDYGDPWQIISVFDGDSDTKVVCEGYAKAFQYLCDLTNFDTEIECLSVTGTLTGGTGNGRHMWNVVQLPDGENYLVDLTNCDGDAVGSPYRLFLAGADSVSENGVFFFLTDKISYQYDRDTESLYDAQDLVFASHPAHQTHLSPEEPQLLWNEDSGNYEVEYTCLLCGEDVTEVCGEDPVLPAAE